VAPGAKPATVPLSTDFRSMTTMEPLSSNDTATSFAPLIVP
jgi:hypothetical protein